MSPPASGCASRSRAHVRPLGELGGLLPEPPGRRDDAQPDDGIVDRQRPVHRGAHVRLLEVEPLHPERCLGSAQVWAGRLGELEEGHRVSTLALDALARLVQPVAREFGEQGVALEARLTVGGRVDPDEALVRQRLETVDDKKLETPGRIDHVLGALGIPAVMEDRAAAEDRLLVARQQVMTPRDRAAERALAFGQVARAAREEIETRLEPLQDDDRREHPRPGGRELDGERQALEPLDDPPDGGDVRVPGRDIGADEPGAVEEQLDPAVRVERPDGVFAFAGDPESLATGDDDAQFGRGEEELGDVGRGLGQELFEVVEDEQRDERLEALPGASA